MKDHHFHKDRAVRLTRSKEKASQDVETHYQRPAHKPAQLTLASQPAPAAGGLLNCAAPTGRTSDAHRILLLGTARERGWRQAIHSTPRNPQFVPQDLRAPAFPLQGAQRDHPMPASTCILGGTRQSLCASRTLLTSPQGATGGLQA